MNVDLTARPAAEALTKNGCFVRAAAVQPGQSAARCVKGSYQEAARVKFDLLEWPVRAVLEARHWRVVGFAVLPPSSALSPKCIPLARKKSGCEFGIVINQAVCRIERVSK